MVEGQPAEASKRPGFAKRARACCQPGHQNILPPEFLLVPCDSRPTSPVRRPIGFRFALLAAVTAAGAQTARAVDYLRDVRPILAGKCFACHGADDAARQAGLRLDERDAAIAQLDSGERAIVPGKPDDSALLARITSSDAQFAMPPAETGKKLSPQEVATLRAWIAADAPYARHWAYVKPVRPALPAVRRGNWPRGAIDHFVLARLEAEGLAPSPPADRETLIRRVSLDLTGLPPTADEVQDFVLDSRGEAYAELVDRLLAKPAYGERWAAMWLDLARYADSQGYAPDGPRTIWRWRDWVIAALNANMPYDRFTIEQLAGDLLAEPSVTQIAATGFHRNTQLNTEGGVNLEEFRHAAVVDRVNTTFAVWMGTTIGCAQCHHHKYDPFSQRDFYQVFSIFNNTDDFNTDNPVQELPRVGQDAEFARLQADVGAAQARWDEQTKARDALQADWEGRAMQAAAAAPAEAAPADKPPGDDATAEKCPPRTLLRRRQCRRRSPRSSPSRPTSVTKSNKRSCKLIIVACRRSGKRPTNSLPRSNASSTRSAPRCRSCTKERRDRRSFTCAASIKARASR